MLLHHLTSCTSRRAIEREGFTRQPNSSHPDLASFSIDQEAHVKLARGSDWWVIFDLPDEVAAEFPSPINRAYLVPNRVANAYIPFRFERHHGHRCLGCGDLP